MPIGPDKLKASLAKVAALLSTPAVNQAKETPRAPHSEGKGKEAGGTES